MGQRLVWNPKTNRNERVNVPKVPQGLVGQPSRSFISDMISIKLEPKERLSGAEKRRKRKGGSPTGGPGQRGAGTRWTHKKSKKGILV